MKIHFFKEKKDVFVSGVVTRATTTTTTWRRKIFCSKKKGCFKGSGEGKKNDVQNGSNYTGRFCGFCSRQYGLRVGCFTWQENNETRKKLNKKTFLVLLYLFPSFFPKHLPLYFSLVSISFSYSSSFVASAFN